MPKLLLFPHSHFCEKARWALDYKEIAHEAIAIVPGLHLMTVRKLADESSVPVLIDDNGKVIQGSSAIIDHLDANVPCNQLSPETLEDRQACAAIEKTMDLQLGVNIRRILYSSLLNYPAFIRKCFTYSMPAHKKIAYRCIAPKLHRAIYKTYVISPNKVAKAHKEFETAMDLLAKRIEQKPYLVGNKFSRADLSVAAMLSLLTQPPEHPFPWGEIPDPEAQAFCERYRQHPVSLWVTNIYKQYR
jgi:glutathione S-transferase